VPLVDDKSTIEGVQTLPRLNVARPERPEREGGVGLMRNGDPERSALGALFERVPVTMLECGEEGPSAVCPAPTKRSEARSARHEAA
jgi:hypothetical protein